MAKKKLSKAELKAKVGALETALAAAGVAAEQKEKELRAEIDEKKRELQNLYLVVEANRDAYGSLAKPLRDFLDTLKKIEGSEKIHIDIPTEVWTKEDRDNARDAGQTLGKLVPGAERQYRKLKEKSVEYKEISDVLRIMKESIYSSAIFMDKEISDELKEQGYIYDSVKEHPESPEFGMFVVKYTEIVSQKYGGHKQRRAKVEGVIETMASLLNKAGYDVPIEEEIDTDKVLQALRKLFGDKAGVEGEIDDLRKHAARVWDYAKKMKERADKK